MTNEKPTEEEKVKKAVQIIVEIALDRIRDSTKVFTSDREVRELLEHTVISTMMGISLEKRMKSDIEKNQTT